MRLILLLFAAFALAAPSDLLAQYVVNDRADWSVSSDSDWDSWDRDFGSDERFDPDPASGGEAQTPQIHAVLVAGSAGYGNYRHQADVCHAYQLLARNGVPKENIVVMMVDDIAYDKQNPTPGVIINRPNGSDVYAGVPKDYTGKDVTPEVFLKVLLGDAEGLRGIGSGKVLNSGPNDHVFINFVDHGAPGLVAFPESELHAKDLEQVLKQMHTQRRYKRLVFYLEACESGSMFENILPQNMGIFATTAANGEESSYAVYFDPERQTYLGDVYSVNWMEDSDQEDLSRETLQRQYTLVKKETNTSHVMEYGDKRFRNLPVGEFLGEPSADVEPIVYEPVVFDPIDSRDVPRILLEKRMELAGTLDERQEAKQKLVRFHKMRKLVTQQFMRIIDELTGGDLQERTRLLKSRYPLRNFGCYEPVAKYFSSHCFSIARNPYTMSKLYIFVNMCETGWKKEAILEAMAGVCGKYDDGEMTGIE